MNSDLNKRRKRYVYPKNYPKSWSFIPLFACFNPCPCTFFIHLRGEIVEAHYNTAYIDIPAH